MEVQPGTDLHEPVRMDAFGRNTWLYGELTCRAYYQGLEAVLGVEGLEARILGWNKFMGVGVIYRSIFLEIKG